MNGTYLDGPVVIGGGGGSGTRVVAQLLMDAGFFLGSDLGPALDSKWFGFLFNRPDWFRMNPVDEQIDIGLSLMRKAIAGPFRPGVVEARFLVGALVGRRGLHGGKGPALEDVVERYLESKDLRTRRPKPLHRYFTGLGSLVHTILGSKPDPEEYRAWGWKAPPSHIILDHLLRYYPDMKYIHVIRNGLDMAFNRNQNQLFNWGWMFDIQPGDDRESLLRASLDYWIVSNRRAVQLGESQGLGRFYLLRYDDLVASPVREAQNLLSFLGVAAGEIDVATLTASIERQTSQGRYRREDLSIFSETQLNSVKALGYQP